MAEPDDLANLLSDDPQPVKMTLRQELEAVYAAFGDPQILEAKSFPALINAYHSAAARADKLESKFVYEHFVHHDGASKSIDSISVPKSCETAVGLGAK